MNTFTQLFSKRVTGVGRPVRRRCRGSVVAGERLEPRALLTVSVPPSITADTVEIDDNVVVANGGGSITATGGPNAGGYVQIFGNSRGRIDGTAGQLDEDLTLRADTSITVTGAIGSIQRIDDLTLTSDTAQPVNLQQSVSLTGDLLVTKAGTFTIGSTVDIDGSLTITEAASVTFSGNVTVDGDLTIVAATNVTFGGMLTVGGSLTIVSATGTTRFLGDVAVKDAAITSSTLVQVMASFTSSGASGVDGDVIFTTDQVSFGTATIGTTASAAGDPTATLTIRPRTLSRDLTIASPPGLPSGLNITDAAIFAIQSGWKRVVFGDEMGGTGAVKIGSIGSQYGGFSQLLNTTTIVGGSIQVVQPVDVTSQASYLELLARTGGVTIDAPINQTADERNDWVRLTAAGSIAINAPIWARQYVALTTTAGGTVSQGGSTAAITTVGLAVLADGVVTLADTGNAVSQLAVETTNDDLVFREDSGYSIGQITTTDDARDVSSTVAVTGIKLGSATARLVTVSAGTASTVSQGRPILASGLGLEGTGTDWSLSLATNDVSTLAGNTGSISFTDTDDLTIDTVVAVSPRASLSGITVARTLSVTAGTTLTMTAAGDITSAATSGSAVTLSAPSGISTAGDVETAGGNAAYNHAVTLTDGILLDLEDGPARGTVSFASTVNGTTSGQESLTIGGNLSASGSIGAVTAVESLWVSGTSSLTGGITLRTTGNQTYTGAATSSGVITIQAGSGSTVAFLGNTTVGGLVTATADTANYDVVLTGTSVSVTAPMTFANTGTVTLGDQTTDNLLFSGGLTTTAPSTTNLAGTISTTDANATFGRHPGGVIALTADTTVATGMGQATFNGTVDATTGGGSALTVSAGGTTSFAQAVGGTRALKSLATSGGGTTMINGATVTTSGSAGQAYGDAVEIGVNDATLTSGTGPVSFDGTVDAASSGGFALSVNAGGTTSFAQAVGGTRALKSLATSGGGTTMINGATVTTSGSAGQAYGDAVEIGVNDATLTSGTGPVSFDGTVDAASSGGLALSVNAGGTTSFAQAVGGTRALKSLATSGGGTTRINGGSVTTSGLAGQSYGDAVTLGANTLLDADAGAINFASILNGTYVLAVNTTGTTTFGDAVGGVDRLVSLSTNAGGSTAINAGSIRTSGADGQVFNDAVTLGNDTTLDAVGGTITFADVVDSGVIAARSLTANTQGETWFAGAVGAVRPLTSLTTDAGGSTRVTADSVTTSGSQTYNDPVTFEQPLVPTSVSTLSVSETLMAGSTVSLLQGLQAASRSLRIEGNAVFGDQPGSPMILGPGTNAVDPIEGLGGLVVTGGSLINSNVISSYTQAVSSWTAPTNPIVFQGGVTLGSDATILGSSVWFQSTVTGSGRAFRVLAITFGGTSATVVFDGDVGTAQAPVGPLQVVCAGTVTINAAIYSTGPVLIDGTSIDGDADNAIRTPNGTVYLEASNGIGATTPIAVQAAGVSALATTGGIRLRGIGDLVVDTDGLIASAGAVDLTASGQIRVPGGRTIEASNGVTTNTPIRWGLLGTDDSGAGSLRSVIGIANATRAAGIIEFAVGQSTFVLQSPLPQITTPLTIDGGNRVTISGNNRVASGITFAAGSSGSGLKNVAIQGFRNFGVRLDNSPGVLVDGVRVTGLNTWESMGLYATGNLSGSSILSSRFSGGIRGALLVNARNLAVGAIGRGNTFAGNRSVPGSTFAGTGIRAQGDSTGTVVEGNTFTQNNYGFAFINARNLRLANNVFTRNTAAAIFVEGMNAGSTSVGNTFGTGAQKNARTMQRVRGATGV